MKLLLALGLLIGLTGCGQNSQPQSQYAYTQPYVGTQPYQYYQYPQGYYVNNGYYWYWYWYRY